MTTALVISRFFPFNPERVHAVYQRLGTQIEALARVADRVDCLFLVPANKSYPPHELRKHEERLRRLWSPSVSLRLAPTVREDEPSTLWQRLGRGVFDFNAQPVARPTNTEAAGGAVGSALDARPDLILAHRLSSMCVVMRLTHQLHGAPLFFDMDDIEHISDFRRLLHHPRWPMERLMLLQIPTLMLAEIQAVRLATATFVSSEEDRRYLTRLSGSDRICTVANSVRFTAVTAKDVSEPLVLFVGSMGYGPNAQAADALVQKIWPSIRAQLPQARLVIIGSRPERATSYPSRDPSVTFAGFVDDLDEWYRRARVICCPIYYGAGTRVKIIEAAAHGRAIVSTPLGAEGLNFEDGRHIVLRDAAADLAAECVRLLRDARAAEQLGAAARQRARAIYDRATVVEQLVQIFRGHSGGTSAYREVTTPGTRDTE
jgi:glycosyltransferase involved in cell wall biosynthesis